MSYFLTINDIHTQPWGKILFLMRKIMSTLSISPEEAPQVSASIYSVLLSSVPVHRVECWLLFTSVAQLWQSQAWVSLFTHTITHLNMAFVWVILTPSWLSLTCPVSSVISPATPSTRQHHPRNQEDSGLWTVQMFNGSMVTQGTEVELVYMQIKTLLLFIFLFHSNLSQWITIFVDK